MFGDICKVHADHDEVAVREVDQPQHAKGQAEPDAEQAINRTCENAKNERLDKCCHRRSPPSRRHQVVASRVKSFDLSEQQAGPAEMASAISRRRDLPAPSGYLPLIGM